MVVPPKKKTMMELYQSQKETTSLPKKYEYPKLRDYAGCPSFPEDLTKVSYKLLGRLRTKYTGFKAFVSEKIAMYRYRFSRAKALRKRKWAVLLFSSRGIKAQKLASVQRDPEYIELDNAALREETMVIAYQSMMWTLGDFIKAIEFEVERRAQGYRANVED